MGFSLVVVSENYSLGAAHALPTAVASLVAENRFLGAWASKLQDVGPVVVAPGTPEPGLIVVVHGLSCPVTCGIFPE